jgi:Cof subfamily protein (haloacid dehalogenase superfamily)
LSATLYISDLDGTLLGNDGLLSSASRRLLTALLDEGLVFSVASARSVVSMQPVLHGLPLKLPVIEFNGAYLSDLTTGRHEVVNSIESSIAEEVYAAITAAGRRPLVSTFDGAADRVFHAAASNDGEAFYLENRRLHKDHRLREAVDISVSLRDQVVCFTVIAEREPLVEIEAALRERCGAAIEMHLFENAYSPGWYWLTVHDRRASKDQGIRLLMDVYDLASHDLVVFGDHINDVKMFGIAQHAVAVANAQEEVKRVATQIIGANEEDSVAQFIREHRSATRKTV